MSGRDVGRPGGGAITTMAVKCNTVYMYIAKAKLSREAEHAKLSPALPASRVTVPVHQLPAVLFSADY